MARLFTTKIIPVAECRECEARVDEIAGYWVILGEKPDGDGFDWMFLCLPCVRDWKRRGLEREGHATADISTMLDQSHPLA